MRPGMLLCSGGIDSVVMAYWLASHGALHSMFLCDYGQASADHQSGIVFEHAEKLKVPYRREHFDWPDYAKGKGYIFERYKFPEGMTDAYAPTRMTKPEYDQYLEDQWDFIQGRNIAFLARAGAYAISLGLDTIYVAFQFDQPEWDAGPAWCDTSPSFVDAFNDLAAAGGFSKRLRIEAPFLDQRKTKIQIVALGRLLGVSLERTYSCEFFPACGQCHQCLIRKDVLAARIRVR